MPPQRPPQPLADTEATRYLCVAAHLDERFADRLLDEVFGDELRAVAPSVDFDLSPVLRHCLAARRRRRRRDLLLLLFGALAVLLAPLWTVTVAVAMRAGTSLAPFRPTRQSQIGPLLGMVSIALAAMVLLVQLTATTAEEGTNWLIGRPWLALPAGIAAFLALVVHLHGTRWLLVTRLRRDRFSAAATDDAPVPSRYAARLAAVDKAQRGNATVYSGYLPFVGHGTPVAGWSFALPIRPAEHVIGGRAAAGDQVPTPFTVDQLIDHVRERLAVLDSDPSTDRLSGLVLQDRIFVVGRLLTDDDRLLPLRNRLPRQHWTSEQVRQVAAHPQGAVRHYLCAMVPSWGGEVVASTFLHFSTDGRLLYLECARTVLQPPRLAYHDVDRLTEWLPASQLVQLLAAGSHALLNTAATAVGRLLDELVHTLRHRRRQARLRRLAGEDLGYDYGARAGAREMATSSDYHNYFQVLDAAKHLKVVERHVLAAIVEFLDDRGVDTAEFRNRQMMILNQGVIQTGGLSVVGNQAVGAGARAEQHGPPAPAGDRPRPA
ncbi:hypothetical protein SAMN05443287_10264 [Micromonospora phaseoli]|uniref:Uncharacterized protein n=1 Tax=Micromonospora phaseoli TaxID=1144548 RepID=A0A1H6U184_9ACTN|nr:hypothetical protein CLV64_10465 [Micromonospora phaseoli]GIJ76420.1 hypothetical protein Xph01_08520 [Micromonospora phaseoli]SEI86063.1 hypothetical protein SAMN05443287_10264 [Micromonospora phaseoli]